jgi:hypothetical protein
VKEERERAGDQGEAKKRNEKKEKEKYEWKAKQ